MKIQSAFFALFLMVFSMKASANPVEVAQWLPWPFLNTVAPRVPMSFQFQAEKMNLNWQDWQPEGVGVSLSVTEGQAQSRFDAKGLQIQAQNFSAVLQVQQLVINQTIVREINGNKITIRVQANCQPFQITVPAFSFAMNLPFENQSGFWAPHLTESQLQIPDQSWTTTPIVCAGPLGLDDKITEYIRTSLQNSDSLKDLLQSFLGPKIDQFSKDKWKELLASELESLRVKKMSDPMAEGFFLIGEINSQSPGQAIPLPSLAGLKLSLTDPQLLISNSGFESMVQAGVRQLTAQKMDLQKVAGFKKLANNRFLQFFMWPDLLHYSRSAPFTLSTLPDAKTELQSVGNGVWNLRAQVQGKIEAQRSGKTVDYIQWGLGLGAKLKTVIEDSQLRFDLLNPQTSLRWAFDSNYVKKFRPFGGISSSVLNQATQALFTNRSVQFALPTLKMQAQEWKLNGFQTEKDVILVNWKTKSLP